MSRPATARLVLAASLGGTLIGCGRGTPAEPRARLNILLVTIDTFRADRIGVGVAPAIDRLSASGLRFTAARTAVPLTLPSHATIHTGLLPPQHGVRENGAGALAASRRTVARLLKDAGYRTGAFVGAFVLDRRFGLAQGFDVYDDQIARDPNATERLEAERPASAVIDRPLGWLTRQPQASGPKPQGAPTPPGTQPPQPPPPTPQSLLHLDPPLRSTCAIRAAAGVRGAGQDAVRRRDRLRRRAARAPARRAPCPRRSRSHARRRRRRSWRGTRRPRRADARDAALRVDAARPAGARRAGRAAADDRCAREPHRNRADATARCGRDATGRDEGARFDRPGLR